MIPEKAPRSSLLSGIRSIAALEILCLPTRNLFRSKGVRLYSMSRLSPL